MRQFESNTAGCARNQGRLGSEERIAGTHDSVIADFGVALQCERRQWAIGSSNGVYLPSAFFNSRNVTTCQRCCLGSCDHDGIPLLRSPLVMNQKTSPDLAFLTFELNRVGAGPMPCKLLP